QHPDRRRLAGAVRAQEPEDLAALDVERHVSDGGERAEHARDVAYDNGTAHEPLPTSAMNASSSDGRAGSIMTSCTPHAASADCTAWRSVPSSVTACTVSPNRVACRTPGTCRSALRTSRALPPRTL